MYRGANLCVCIEFQSQYPDMCNPKPAFRMNIISQLRKRGSSERCSLQTDRHRVWRCLCALRGFWCNVSHNILHRIFQYICCFKENFSIFSFISPFMKIESFCTEFNIMTEVLVKYSSKNDLDIAFSLLCCNWRPVFTLLGT